MKLFHYLDTLPWALATTVLVGLFIIISVVGLLFVRKNIDAQLLRKHHDVAGFVFTNLGVLYSVLLGFTVVNVQQRFDRIQQTVETEASYLSELYRDAAVFSEKDRDSVRQSIVNYTKSVLFVEWPLMGEQKTSTETVKMLNNLWHSYYAVTTTTEKQNFWYSQSISKLNDLMSVRLSRLLGSKESLGAEMWYLLILGGLMIIAFLWFFGVENLTSHIIMSIALTASTAFLLFLIFSLDTTFSGEVSVSNEAWHSLLEAFMTKNT